MRNRTIAIFIILPLCLVVIFLGSWFFGLRWLVSNVYGDNSEQKKSTAKLVAYLEQHKPQIWPNTDVDIYGLPSYSSLCAAKSPPVMHSKCPFIAILPRRGSAEGGSISRLSKRDLSREDFKLLQPELYLSVVEVRAVGDHRGNVTPYSLGRDFHVVDSYLVVF